MNKKGLETPILLFGLFLFIILVIGLIYIFVNNSNKPDINEQEIKYSIYFDVKDTKDNYINANYTIFLDTLVIKEGIYLSGTLEQFNQAQNNTWYNISAKNNDYYDNSQMCTNLDSNCTVQLEPISNLSIFLNDLNNGNAKLLVTLDEGVYRKPLICFGLDYNILNFNLLGEFNKIDIPQLDLIKDKVDVCYNYNYDLINQNNLFDINYKKVDDLVDGTITGYIIDNCHDTYNEGCGKDYIIEAII